MTEDEEKKKKTLTADRRLTSSEGGALWVNGLGTYLFKLNFPHSPHRASRPTHEQHVQRAELLERRVGVRDQQRVARAAAQQLELRL